MREFLRIWNYLVKCAQSHTTPVNKLNWLFTVVPQDMWPNYDTDPYPAKLPDPGNVQCLTVGQDPAYNQLYKAQHEVQLKNYTEYRNMNKALVEVFLSLIDPTYRIIYEKTQLIRDPNKSFEDVFKHFFQKYVDDDVRDIENNLEEMKSPWDPRDGFDALEIKIDNGMVNAALAKRPLSDADVMQKALYNILETGQFGEEIKQWYTLTADQQASWIFGKEWWRGKYALHKKLTKSAGGFQYGQNVTDDVDAEYNNAVDSFAMAHNALNHLTSGIPAIQQQMQQQAMMMQQMHQQNQQLQQILLAQQHNNNNNSNNNNNNNNYNNR